MTKDENVQLKPGDTAHIGTPGGGGWGDPAKRDPSRVQRDVQLEFVTVEEARRNYRVAIERSGDAYSLDHAETARLRQLTIR